MRFEIDLVICSSPLEMLAKASLLASGEWHANGNWVERPAWGKKANINEEV